MKSYIIFCVVSLHVGWTYGVPAVKGVGAYSYQDSAGNRYGGTYGLDDAKVYSSKKGHNGANSGDYGNFAGAQVYTSGNENDDWGNFAPFEQSFQQFDNFIPEYFNNLQNLLNDITGQRIITSESEVERFAPLRPLSGFKPLKPMRPLRPFPNIQRTKRFLRPLPPLPPLPGLPPLQPLQPLFPRLRPLLPPLQPLFQRKRAFNSNFENQKLAYNAARKAFDLTSNQAGYIPNFPSRFHGYDFDGFNQYMMPFGPNSAYAGAAAGPGFSHQVAALSPENPSEPNVNVMNRFADTSGPGKFYSVSSSSYASSANVNGHEQNVRGAETLVNNNGKVTRYSVQS